MDITGEFHLIEKDGKLFLEYYHSKYHPLSQLQGPSSSNKTAINNHLSQSLFYHSVVPCNNNEYEIFGKCWICYGSYSSTNYYFCHYCVKIYHRECVQFPLQINSPFHPYHSLQLYFKTPGGRINECLCCGRTICCLLYSCGICQVFMHQECAMKPIPFVVDLPKRHDHPLTFFPRQASLTCNVCGLLRKLYSTYICAKCNFVAHKDCMYFPSIIKISRHRHRISYSPSLRSGEWLCGVCRQNIETSFGAYTCGKCCDYFVHSICATGKYVWDGKDLEGIPEKDDITPDVEPFVMISEGVILHFLHDHHLYLQVSMLYDESKYCQGCALAIFEGNLYSCIECDFILHETCAKSARILEHALHRHPLTLSPFRFDNRYICNACHRLCGGFHYGCHSEECDFDLDIRCASISEPFDYHGHEHPLYFALNQEEKPICHVCKRKCNEQGNCINCDFIICMKCITLPSKARYKHDKHFLRVLCRKEVCEKSWCEVCEQDLKDKNTNVVYWCDECCITVHVQCLLGVEPYMKPYQAFKIKGRKQK